MNTSSSFNSFTSPPLLSTSKPPQKPFSIPRFSPKMIRCIHDSPINLDFKSNPNSPTLKFPISFATSSIKSPLKTTTTKEKLHHLVTEFRSLTEPIDRVKRLLNYATALEPLDDSARIPQNRVKGCTTQVWLDIKIDDLGRLKFRADSDSEISKGFCSCLIWIVDGAKAEEVMSIRGEDLSDMNVGVYGKAQSRVNTWHNVLMSMQNRTMSLVGERLDNDDLLFKYVNGSFMESSKISDYSISLLPLYYDFTI